MMTLCSEVISRLQGKTLVTAESCTGGGIGWHLTAVSGSSAVYKGGVISYCNAVKHSVLGVEAELLEKIGPVSAPVAQAMAYGARRVLDADIAVSVTGLAGPGGDDYGNPQGRVHIGYSDKEITLSREFTFPGDREQVRVQAVQEAMKLILEQNPEK